MTTEPTVSQEAVSQEDNFEAPPHALQVADIENAVKAIDYASEQGAFKGWNTIQEVLNIRNKLVLFLHHAKAEIEAAQAAEAAANGETTGDTAEAPAEVETPAEGAE